MIARQIDVKVRKAWQLYSKTYAAAITTGNFPFIPSEIRK